MTQISAPFRLHRRAMPGQVDRRPAPPAAAPLPPEEQGRADVYALAAWLLLAAPDEAFLHSLASARDFTGAGVDAGLDKTWGHLRCAAVALPAQLVAEEFAALFEGLGSPLLDPYASMYVAGFMMERPLARLRSDLAALGLARTRNATVPEDHFGALCEVMRLLIVGAAQFPPQPLDSQRRFFEAHLQPWAGRCLDDIERARPAGFYGCVARYLRCFFLLEERAFQLADADLAQAQAVPISD